MKLHKLLHYLLAALWMILPILASPVLDHITVDASNSVAIGLETALWALWFIGLVAILVPGVISLTTIRVINPLTLFIATYGVLNLDSSMEITAITVASVLITFITLSSQIGDRFVNASAYGSERRLALKPPAVFENLIIPTMWIATSALGAATYLNLAQGITILNLAGVVLTVIASSIMWKVFHQFSKRWLVFVPAGFVIHDDFQLTNSSLFRRHNTKKLTTATKSENDDNEIIDLTAAASGLVLELETIDEVEIAVKNPNPKLIHSKNILISPTLPGSTLTEARIRGIKTRLDS